MRTLDTIQKLSKIGRTLSKIAFIFSVIGVCGCIVGLLSLRLGSGGLLRLGGVTLHGLIDRLCRGSGACKVCGGLLQK